MVTKPILFKRDFENTELELKQPSFEINPDDPLEQQVITAIRGIYDPEISVNIYDLGLIYEIRLINGNKVLSPL